MTVLVVGVLHLPEKLIINTVVNFLYYGLSSHMMSVTGARLFCGSLLQVSTTEIYDEERERQ